MTIGALMHVVRGFGHGLVGSAARALEFCAILDLDVTIAEFFMSSAMNVLAKNARALLTRKIRDGKMVELNRRGKIRDITRANFASQLESSLGSRIENCSLVVGHVSHRCETRLM